MTEAPSLYAVLWSRDGAVEALNVRRVEVGLSMNELDDAADQAKGTAAKYLGPSQTKSLGIESLFKLAWALGLRIVLEVDAEATAMLLDESRKRQGNQARIGNYAQPVGMRVLARVQRHLALRGIKARNRKMTKEERSESARRAALARWHRWARKPDITKVRVIESPNAVIKTASSSTAAKLRQS